MAGIDSETDESRAEIAASVTIKLRLIGFETGNTLTGFWSYFREIARYARREAEARDTSPEEFEQQIRDNFPYELKKRFQNFVEGYHNQTYAGRLSDRQYNALRKMEISVAEISYGSIEIKTIIDNLDEVIRAFGLTVDIVTAALMLTSPDALNAVLDTPSLEWAAAIPAMSIPSSVPQPTPSPNPSPMPTDTGNTQSPGALSRFSSPTFVWKLLNAMWVLPILVALTVLVLAYREMNRITELHDTDRSKLLADEIGRVAARSDRFSEQHALLLQRQENVLKETTETLKTILSDEVKRVAARSDYYDQQQVLLLQRYESLSKETSEIIKTLIQQPDSCCKACDCGCNKPKDPCQKANGTK
jgi:hypothetical protein